MRYYDRDGDTVEAENANAAADKVYGPPGASGRNGTSMYSYGADGWVEHVLGSGGADLLITDGDLPFRLMDAIDEATGQSRR